MNLRTGVLLYENLLANMMEELEFFPKEGARSFRIPPRRFDTIINRISRRGRDFEQDASQLAYFRRLWEGYRDWVKKIAITSRLSLSSIPTATTSAIGKPAPFAGAGRPEVGRVRASRRRVPGAHGSRRALSVMADGVVKRSAGAMMSRGRAGDPRPLARDRGRRRAWVVAVPAVLSR